VESPQAFPIYEARPETHGRTIEIGAPVKPMRLKESSVMAYVRELAAYSGYRVHRLQCGRWRSLDGKRVVTMEIAGMPDLLMVHPRRDPIYVETKALTGKTSKHQEIVHAALREMGFRVEVVRTWEEAKALFER
jgi:hypothetical protein